MRVLVVYGSTQGGTAGLATMVQGALRARGCDVAVHPAAWIRHIDCFDAVVVGGALYRNRWHRHARRFVTRHRAELRGRPVWFFSSGPLDDSARDGSIPPTPQVTRLMDLVAARGHMTFGGCSLVDPTGSPYEDGDRPSSRDWRDPVQVTDWVGVIAAELGAGPRPVASGSGVGPPGVPGVIAARSVPGVDSAPEEHLQDVGG